MHMLAANKLGALSVLLADRVGAALGDFSPSAAALLLTLRYHGAKTGSKTGAMTVSALAPILGVAQPTAVRVAQGLARRGLIAARGREGRTAPLALTREGRRRADALARARLAAVERLLTPLSGKKRARLERLIDALLGEAAESRALARRICRLCDHDICAGPLCPVGSRASALERAEAQGTNGC
ncbi:MAG TPA: MarR family winged helix-turn-helix transcriptional regulator [Acetobacteraceae bacterium]|nr:MarR family winged helix-turn-helix transcriptional regulator [Acetobacteraceae bacterium]